jgi:hypothetical protein
MKRGRISPDLCEFTQRERIELDVVSMQTFRRVLRLACNTQRQRLERRLTRAWVRESRIEQEIRELCP